MVEGTEPLRAQGSVLAGTGLLVAAWTLAMVLGGGGPEFPRPDDRGREENGAPGIGRPADPAVPPGSLPAGVGRPEAVRLVDLNRAGREALATLPGIGPTLADRIVADRDRRGPFGDPADLLRVPGIGAKRLAQVRPHLTVTEGP